MPARHFSHVKDAMLAAGSADQNVNIWDMRQLQLAYRPPDEGM